MMSRNQSNAKKQIPMVLKGKPENWPPDSLKNI
jgi:hypothetical protein